MSLAVGLWVDLICVPFLNLDDLVRVRSLSRTFYSYERLKALIEKMMQERFGKIPRKFWNRFANDYEVFGGAYFPTRFVIHVRTLLYGGMCCI